MSFNNKVVIVTGASSGIGAATALRFAKEGADVVLVARNHAKLAAIAKQIETLGKNPLIIPADVSKDTEANAVISQTVDHFGKLDILVNNAAVSTEGSILDGKVVEAYDEIMKTNVRAVIRLTSLAAPFLSTTKGNVVNVSSAAANTTSRLATLLPYYVSKAALDHFTRCAARELAGCGVRVNTVNPGPVDNDFLSHNGFSAATKIKQGLLDNIPLGFLSTDDEIAGVILFLASEKARSVTGSGYAIDNGYLLM